MSKNKTKNEFLNAADQTEVPTAFVYDPEINNYVEKPLSLIAAKSEQQRPTVIYVPEKNAYDEPPAP